MRTTNLSIRKAAAKGFSLVEMLVVIAIIGVIAAIAVPNISSLTDSANDAKDKRNAQNLASVCASAQAAGLDFIPDGTDAVEAGDAALDPILKVVRTGTTVSGGSFDGDYFGVPGLTDADITKAAKFLKIENNVLVYIAGNK